MGPSLANMFPRLEAILRSGLEPHLSLKVMQHTSILLGPQVVEPLAAVLRDLLVNLTSCIHTDSKGDDAMDDGNRSKGTDRGVATTRDAMASLHFAGSLMETYPDIGLPICSPAIAKVIAALPGSKSLNASLVEAAFHSFSRIVWASPNSLEDTFAGDPQQDEKINFVVNTWISVVSSASVIALLSANAQKIRFIWQKGAALSMCSAVCRSPRVGRAAGELIINFTKKLVEVELRANLDVDALVEATANTTRKVVGDGPLGDSAARTVEILKTE